MIKSANSQGPVPAFYRTLMLGSAVTYFLWWFVVRALMPHAQNPFLSRAALVVLIGGVAIASRSVEWVFRSLSFWASLGFWAITGHFFYLFKLNQGSNDWIVGAYITVGAISYCFQTMKALIGYSVLVTFLSIFVNVSLPGASLTLFFPGLATILAFSFLSLNARLKFQQVLNEKDAKTRALTMRDDFISIITHELKTPLTSLKLLAHLAVRRATHPMGSGDPSMELIDFAKKVDRQADRLDGLVNQMIEVSKDTRNKNELDFGPLDLRVLLSDLLQGLQGILDEASVVATLNIRGNVNLIGDRFRLEQVFSNLLLNAIKYGQGSPITVEAVEDVDEVVISVRDLGIGIAKEDQNRIFGKFERAVSEKKISGLGLGLFICRNFVEAHQGSIEVVSSPLEGACFTIRLPKSQPVQGGGPSENDFSH